MSGSTVIGTVIVGAADEDEQWVGSSGTVAFEAELWPSGLALEHWARGAAPSFEVGASASSSASHRVATTRVCCCGTSTSNFRTCPARTAARARCSISDREPADESPFASHTASRARRPSARSASSCAWTAAVGAGATDELEAFAASKLSGTTAGSERAAAAWDDGYMGSPSTSLESESDPQSAGGSPYAI
eukprot:scaffold133400_cov24-Tisochrysis_lutea.AAC.1